MLILIPLYQARKADILPRRLSGKMWNRSFSQNILGIYMQVKRKYENLAYLFEYVDIKYVL